MTDHISLMSVGTYDKLLSDTADSPIVKEAGSDNQFTLLQVLLMDFKAYILDDYMEFRCMQEKLIWEAFSHNDRNETITQIKNIIFKNGAYIINFNMFSDLALSLSLSIEQHKIFDLHNALGNVLKLPDIKAQDSHQKSNKDVIIFMNVSFIKGTGNLKIKVPAVPG